MRLVRAHEELQAHEFAVCFLVDELAGQAQSMNSSSVDSCDDSTESIVVVAMS